MTTVECHGGYTQIRKVLAHARQEAEKRKVNALVYVGDCMEEDVDDLCGRAGELALHGVPVFLFQEGARCARRARFREIARLTKGAWCRFDPGSAAPAARPADGRGRLRRRAGRKALLALSGERERRAGAPAARSSSNPAGWPAPDALLPPRIGGARSGRSSLMRRLSLKANPANARAAAAHRRRRRGAAGRRRRCSCAALAAYRVAPRRCSGRGCIWGRTLPPWLGGGGKRGARRGRPRASTTDHLEMELDHDTGDMHGRVLKGMFAGREIEDLQPRRSRRFCGRIAASHRPAVGAARRGLSRPHPPDLARGHGARRIRA